MNFRYLMCIGIGCSVIGCQQPGSQSARSSGPQSLASTQSTAVAVATANPSDAATRPVSAKPSPSEGEGSAKPDAARPQPPQTPEVAAEAPTPSPSGKAGEMLQSKAEMAGYGAEISRVVDRKNEIISVLRNGMVVICQRVPSPVVAVRGYCFTGGVYEGKWLGGGLSHLLEHLVAGGSSERRTEAQNRDLLQKIGNNSNAYTSEDHTAFFVNTTTDHMEQAVDLVTGWMLGALITPAEYRREYQVVQRELEMGKGEPDRQFYYMAAANRYKVSPARIPVIGYQEVIQGLSRDDVYSYYKLAYQPNNMLFSLAGDIEPEQMLKAVQRLVADAKPGRVFSHDIAQEPRVMAPRTAVATFPKLGQAKLQIGFPSVRVDHQDLYALDLLAGVLGGGESSLLVHEIRDKQQLVSAISVNDETPSYVDGTFTVDMELDPEKVEQATRAVLTILDSMKTRGADEDALLRAKTDIRAARVKRLQTAEEIASSLAEDYMSTGDAHFGDDYVARIEALKADDLMRVAAKYFDRSRLLTTALLPSEYAGARGLSQAADLLRAAPTTGAATRPAGVASDVMRSELENGITLLVKRITTSPVVVIQMYALGGVTAEGADTNGLGNLTMQLLTRGTATRSADEIARFFASTGGEMTGSCGNNTFSWNANCLKDNFEKTMEVYADIVVHPAFSETEIDPMKRRIAARISGEDADWTSQAFRYFKKEFYGPQHSPYQFTVPGTLENVQKFSRDQITGWYQNKVLGGHRVLAIYGDVDPGRAQQLAADLLGKGEKPKEVATTESAISPSIAPVSATPSIEVERVAVQKTDQQLAGVVIGFNSNAYVGSSDIYNLTVAQTIAGGYKFPTGYLFETLRGRGLVYVVEAVNSPGRSPQFPGSFLVFAGCDPARVNEVVESSLLNIAREQGTPADINEPWFARSKELITLADAMDHETPAEQASAAGIDELFGLGFNYNQAFAARIRAVTLPDVQKLAREKLNHCVVTISTPAPELVKIQSGRREYSSFPPIELTPRGIQHDTGGAAR